MTAKGALDRLAEAELERHRLDLRFADIQLCKRGEYEVVARELRRRKYRTVCLYGGVVVAFSILGILFGPRSVIFYILIYGLAALRMFEEYIDARRTEEILRRLREERDRLNREARAGTAPNTAASDVRTENEPQW